MSISKKIIRATVPIVFLEDELKKRSGLCRHCFFHLTHLLTHLNIVAHLRIPIERAYLVSRDFPALPNFKGKNPGNEVCSFAITLQGLSSLKLAGGLYSSDEGLTYIRDKKWHKILIGQGRRNALQDESGNKASTLRHNAPEEQHSM